MTYQTATIVGSSGNDHTEQLRTLLESTQKRPVDYAEAQEVGGSLLSFFKTLAEGGQQQDTSWTH